MLRPSRFFAPFLLLAGAVMLTGCGGGTFGDRISNGGLCALPIVILDIMAFVSLFQSNASTGSKLLWAAVIFFLPLLGLIIWYFAGPKKA